MLDRIRNGINRRILNWVSTRLRRVPGPVQVVRQRVYILPTRQGLAFGVMLFVMLLGSMNYSNSLGFALTFLLTGLGLVCMHHTHRNLVNLVARQERHPPVFAGQHAVFQIGIANPSAADRYAIVLAHVDQQNIDGITDIPAHADATVYLRVPTQRRGRVEAPRFSLSTEFPLGLFHAWTWIDLDMYCVVYPKPAEKKRKMPPVPGKRSGRKMGDSGQEDYAGLREYQRGDSPRTIHWKTFPRSGQLSVKVFADPVDEELWIDWNSLPGMDTEQRLSQLCRWILDAHRDGMNYGLRLPGTSVELGTGEPHRHRCLQALALFDGAAS